MYMYNSFGDGSSSSTHGLFNCVIFPSLVFRAVRILQSVHDALDLKTAVEVWYESAVGLQTIKIRKYAISRSFS